MNFLSGMEDFDGAKGRAMRVASDLDATALHVDDPVVGNPGLGVEARLQASILGEAAVGDLDDKEDIPGRRIRSG